MIPKYLSAISTVAPAVGNHLWQSTLCLVIAGLLTLILRKNHARTRHGLWLVASVKFLIPFSLLVILGSHLAKPRVLVPTEPGLFFALEKVSQPFTQATVRVTPAVVHSTTPSNLLPLLPAFFVAAWLCGFVAVLFTWWVRWRRMSRVLREALPLREGREVQVLRRLEREVGLRKPVEVFLCQASLEPGIFGIARPVLVLSEGISKHLDDAHLEAILAHEVCHARRRDNLAAAVHMVVEALFWFHPLVWWLGGRLVEERERACDEEVLERGGDRQVYAESLLRTCEFCVGSPLACVSRITGADLKKRILRIMTERGGRKLDLSRKLVLVVAGLLAVAAPVMFGIVNTPQTGSSSLSASTVASAPRFETVSIKSYESDAPGRRLGFSITDPPDDGTFYATDVTVERVVEMAYRVKYSWLILGAPSWLDSDTFDIQAKADEAVNNQLRALSPEQGLVLKHRLLQALLFDRFKLKAHRETKDLPVYALVIAKNGPKLREAESSDTYPGGGEGVDGRARGDRGSFHFKVEGGQFKLTGQAVSLQALVQVLMDQPTVDRPILDRTGLKGNHDINFLARLLMDLHLLHRPVLDQGGLKGNYDFTLQWTSDQNLAPLFKGPADGNRATENAPRSESSGPSLFTAIQQQLGLKLEPTKAPVEVLVIDHVERPSEN